MPHLSHEELESQYSYYERGILRGKPSNTHSIGKDSSVMLRLAEKAFYLPLAISAFASTRDGSSRQCMNLEKRF